MEKLPINIDDLVFDLNNPRLRDVGSQNEALKGLIELGTPYFRTLMSSIKANGLDPGDCFYVLEDPTNESDYIVVDGNRRLAAIIALRNPQRLKGIGLSTTDVNSLSRIATGYLLDSIQEVECVVFDDRNLADAWIMRRHGRDLGGEGRLTWGPLEIDRFQRDHSNLDVIDFVSRNTTIPDGDWQDIKNAVENNSSSLSRFLNNKHFRQAIGFTVTEEVDESKVPSMAGDVSIILSYFEEIFKDIHGKVINTRNYNTSSEIEAYIDDLVVKKGHATAEVQSSVRFRDVVISAPSSETEGDFSSKKISTPAKTTRTKKPRHQLAEKRHPFEQPATTKGQRLILEASKLSTKDFPLASAYTLRAFLEHTIDTYMTLHNMPRGDAKRNFELQKRAELVIDHLVSSKAVANAQELRGAKRVLTDTKNPSSIQALNDYHHDRYQIPPADTLRNAWDACLPLFSAVYGPVSSS